MSETVLVTGGYGFLGRAVARGVQGCRLSRCGHRARTLGCSGAAAHGFDSWLDAGVTLSSLMTLASHSSMVAHCGGNGSVGYSLANPYRTSTRLCRVPRTCSSSCDSAIRRPCWSTPPAPPCMARSLMRPSRRTAELTPISPYGYHKKDRRGSVAILFDALTACALPSSGSFPFTDRD